VEQIFHRLSQGSARRGLRLSSRVFNLGVLNMLQFALMKSPGTLIGKSRVLYGTIDGTNTAPGGTEFKS